MGSSPPFVGCVFSSFNAVFGESRVVIYCCEIMVRGTSISLGNVSHVFLKYVMGFEELFLVN